MRRLARLTRLATAAATAVAVVAGPALPAAAQAFDPSGIVEMRLLPGWRQDDGSHVAALEIRLAPGWKTYWRSPGEGGIPPELRLDAEIVGQHWPSPEIFTSNGLTTVGYSDAVILPLELALSPGQTRLTGEAAIGVCSDVCVPVSARIEADLPAEGRRDPRIVAAIADDPMTAAEAGAGAATCSLRPIPDGLRVEARLPVPQGGGSNEVVVFELPDRAIWISGAETARAGGIVTASADIVPPDAGPFALDRSSLRITLLDGGRAVEWQGCRAG
ncbi:hypothetical protein HKCCE2091_00760 [Rhodobacterales bacterium HKCCE2091]|nr:hypothetical protein [Rhodobacterales bacterium HKCCE2091]